MSKGLTARASVRIRASIVKVWDALVKPDLIKQYMFGTDVVSDFREGSSITWKGTWEGKPYEDKGRILKAECLEKLEFTHFSPLSGVPDKPENYHTVTYLLSEEGPDTIVTLTQDNNSDEKEKDHSERNWESMLSGLKKMLEK